MSEVELEPMFKEEVHHLMETYQMLEKNKVIESTKLKLSDFSTIELKEVEL